MSDADDAFAAAEAEIEKVRQAEGTRLDLSGARFAALTRLPDSIGKLELETLKIGDTSGSRATKVTDLTPLTSLTNLKTLDIEETPVSDLSGLQDLRQLETLNASYTKTTDLESLQALTELLRLSLIGTPVTNIAPLASLSRLITLDLRNTQAADLTPLQGLTGLRSLDLNNTKITDLTPLQGLTGLQTLYLSVTKAADLTPLQGLTGLQTLYLSGTQAADLAPLAGLTGLQSLDLRNTQAADLTPLQGLTGLQTLLLDNTRVTDLTPLQSLTGLQRLDLSSTQITDLTPLQSLTGLQSLNLSSTQITDLAPLAGLTGLQRLDLSSTQITDLAPLAGLTGLQSLFLDNTQVTDLAPLAGLTGLQSLDLDNTQVTDLAPLAGLTGLQSLDLRNTQAADLAPLAGLTGLQRLTLRNTQAADLAPLAGLTGLQSLDLDNTQVSDLRPLLGLERLWDNAGEPVPGTGVPSGLWFADTPATRADATLAELAGIENHKERTEKTRAYLQSLPEWPAPLEGAAEDQSQNPYDPDKRLDAPALPGERAAPLYVSVGDDGRLRREPAPPDLPADQETRAEQAWAALKDYLEELDQPFLDRLDNKMPRLPKALAALARALGDAYGEINEIAVGMACARVTALAGAAGDILSDEDAAEIGAFAAQTALYVRRFNGWVDYQNDPAPAEVTPERLQETRDDFAAILREIQTLDYATAPVTAVYADLVDIAPDEAFDPVAAKGLVFATSNILDATADEALAKAGEMRAADPSRWAALKADFGKEMRAQGIKNATRGAYAGGAATGSAALDLILNQGGVLLHLAQKYPETLGFLEAVVKFFL